MTDLKQLAAALPDAQFLHPEDAAVSITGVAYDSRQVQPGDLFLCVRGFQADGLRFLPDALARGAVAAVVETNPVPDELAAVPGLRVPSVREAMPRLAAAFHGYPSRRLSLVGVTGTNGKTTTTYLVEALARAAGCPTGVIGTIGVRIDDRELPGDRTTPESPDLQALFAEMASGDVGRVVSMEVSSHALALERTWGCEFDVAVFTNLTQDHLDYHGTMEAYFEAKATLFTEYPARSGKSFTAVINVDDPYGRRLTGLSAGRVVTYGIDQAADLRASGVEASPTGLKFDLATPEGVFPVTLRLGGLFNVYNSLAAMGAARALGLEWNTILSAISSASGVPGRFESVETRGLPFSVLVDYAHSPDGLENVLRAARALHPKRLLTVFGCGGDRDRTKRPIMGRLAAELADYVVISSDNPRTEDPDAILAEIAAGVPAGHQSEVRQIADRRAAIEHAITEAGPGDLVVIAGKGHETYQIFRDKTIHFDDREEARKAIDARLSA